MTMNRGVKILNQSEKGYNISVRSRLGPIRSNYHVGKIYIVIETRN